MKEPGFLEYAEGPLWKDWTDSRALQTPALAGTPHSQMTEARSAIEEDFRVALVRVARESMPAVKRLGQLPLAVVLPEEWGQ